MAPNLDITSSIEGNTPYANGKVEKAFVEGAKFVVGLIPTVGIFTGGGSAMINTFTATDDKDDAISQIKSDQVSDDAEKEMLEIETGVIVVIGFGNENGEYATAEVGYNPTK